PLSMTNPSVTGGPYGNYGGGLPLGNYAIPTGSSAANRGTFPSVNYTDAPSYDFFGNVRKTGGSAHPAIAAGAVQPTTATTANGTPSFTITPSTLPFAGQAPRTASVPQDVEVINDGSVLVTINSVSITGTNASS